MIVSCEKCQAPYQVLEDQVDDKGLALECTACHHRFRVLRKAVYVLADLETESNQHVIAATPAPPEELKPSKSPEDSNPSLSGISRSGIPRPKMPIRLRTSPTREAESSSRSGLRTLLLLTICLALGFYWWKRVYPEQFHQAASRLEAIDARVAKRLQPSSISPQAKEAYLNGRGRAVFDTREDYEAAVEQYRQTLNLDPQYAVAWGALGEAATELAEIDLAANDTEGARVWFDEGLRASTRALTLDPQSREGHRAMAAYERLQGRFVQAQEQLDRAMQQDPNDVEIYVAVGRNYLSRPGLEDMAKQYLLKAVAMDEKSIRAHRYLAVVFDRKQEYAESIKHWQKVLDLNGRHSVARFESARLQALLDG